MKSDIKFDEESEILEIVDSASAFLGVPPASKIRNVCTEKSLSVFKSNLRRFLGT